MNKLAIFIDGAYLDKIAKREAGGSPDLELLPENLAQGLPVLRTYYYDSPPFQSDPPTPEERDFTARKNMRFSRLEQLPNFVVRKGKCVKRDTGFIQKQVDVLLVIDLLTLSFRQAITHAALVTGDSDFVPAIDIVKAEGIEVWLYHGGHIGPLNDLWQAADKRFKLPTDFLPLLPDQ